MSSHILAQKVKITQNFKILQLLQKAIFQQKKCNFQFTSHDFVTSVIVWLAVSFLQNLQFYKKIWHFFLFVILQDRKANLPFYNKVFFFLTKKICFWNLRFTRKDCDFYAKCQFYNKSHKFWSRLHVSCLISSKMLLLFESHSSGCSRFEKMSSRKQACCSS